MLKPSIYIALPVMNEMERLPAFMEALRLQTLQEYSLLVCINQPEKWWKDPSQITVCEDNRQAISFLESFKDGRITIIDCSSEGKGWTGKNHGIGWARKVLMDEIAAKALPDDIILSLDADTLFGPRYLESILQNRMNCPSANAISVPYYHRLTGNEPLDRAMLRYEIYMRSFVINLWRIQSPYSFTALGSAIALPVRAYKMIGGMTPKLSGEDFYFMQKLVKTGTIVNWNEEKVYPATRLSNRVFFGTGPALIKGIEGDWDSYPVYNMHWYDDIQETYLCFDRLFTEDIPSPLDEFLISVFGSLPWPALRSNFKTKKHFVRACHEKADGLRLLQYLKSRQKSENLNDDRNLAELLQYLAIHYQSLPAADLNLFDFSASGLSELDAIRNYLENVESFFRKQHYDEVCKLNS